MTSDIRFAVRMLLKSPGFAIVAILTLTLGIGANTAIFSVVNSVLLRPLQARNPERLIAIWGRMNYGGRGSMAYPDIQDLRAQNGSLDQIEAFFPASFNMKSAGRPERVRGARVTAGWFSLFGAQPILGRAFVEREDHPDAAHVVVLSEDLWRTSFGADRGLIGKPVPLDGENYTVVGVMPTSFRFPSPTTRAWIPLIPTQTELRRGYHFLRADGRMKAGVSIDQARSDLSLIMQRIAREFPTDDASRVGADVKSLQQEITGDSTRTLFVMLGAVAFVFLIACANVANLLLVRASSRRTEVAIRRALGASALRLLRQFLIESVLLTGIGAALGWLLALWGIALLVLLKPANIARVNEISPDLRVLGFTIAISLAAAVIFAVASVLNSAAADVNQTLKEGGRGAAGSARNWARSLLVIGEIATALVLLVGAGLLIESFWRLEHVDPGLRADHVLTLRVDLPAAKYRASLPVPKFWAPLIAKVAALPGVQSAGAIDYLPIAVWGVNGDFAIEGRPPSPPGQSPEVEQRIVGAEYFQALRIPLVAGRFFRDSDGLNSPPVVMINQTMASRFWENENPVGSRIRFWGPDWMTIVGVAGNVRQSGIDSEPAPELYASWKQVPVAAPTLGMTLVIRTANDPSSVANAVRAQIQSLDPDQPASNVLTMEEVLSNFLADRRFTMFLLAAFAAVALLLASLGIYGVMAWVVGQRMRDIGIRLALGACGADIFQAVMGQGIRLVTAGLMIGIVGAAALTRVLASLLFGISATDAVTFGAGALVLAAVAMAAIYVPARRATRVDPMVALRYE